MGVIEQSHDGQILLAAFHGKADKIHQTHVGIGRGGQRFLEKSHDFIIGPTEDHGMNHIGGHTFQAVHEDFDYGTDVFIDVLGVDTVSFTLSRHAGQISSRFPVGNRAGKCNV